jgi:hypothetical protein
MLLMVAKLNSKTHLQKKFFLAVYKKIICKNDIWV